ncbi:MAG TPA: Slp family lipoprotein, partial [Gammaproteobacteria bacterium]
LSLSIKGKLMKYVPHALTALLLLGLTACASGPRYDTSQVETNLTASQAAAAPAAHGGARVVWGGVIIVTRNEPSYTEMEILSYPLDSWQRPDISRSEQGRFIVRNANYLEAVDYAPGRQVTISGKIEKVMEGKVGEAPYTFPLVQSDEIYLWPRDGRESSAPRFHFGIGVIFGH